MRKVLGVVAGIIVAMLTITVVEMIGHRAYPTPPGADMGTASGVAAYIATAPTGALLVVVAGWFLGTMLGGWSALGISHWRPASWIIAASIAIAGVFNATQIPAPMWMQIATVLGPALGGFAAHLLPGWKRTG